MKNKVIVFNTDGVGAKILTNPPNLGELASLPNVRVNPDLSAVEGIPPENWYLNPRGMILSKDHPNRDSIRRLSSPVKDSQQDLRLEALEKRLKALQIKTTVALACSILAIGILAALLIHVG